MKKIIFVLLLCCLHFYAAAQQSSNQVFENIPILHGDTIVFPITLVDAFPFVSVEVNGVKGKFMFDTGLNGSIKINDNAVNLPNKKKKGTGIVGSGQTFTDNINDTIVEVKFKNGLTYHNLLNISSANYDFLQNNITPDCIGYIGYEFFKGYTFKLDYVKRKITFYKNTEQHKSSNDFLKDEKVLGIINFETRRLPNHPLVKVKIGNIELLGSFDTGQYGLIQLEDSAKKILIAKSLVRYMGLDGHGDEQVNVSDVKIDGTFKTAIKGIYPITMEQTTPFRKGIQITEDSYICFGYRFFEQYKTVWDYEQKKIYILEK
ncbi:hypothetical protein SD960_11165 [Flavobacterium sp. MMLR14_040]|uniref:hypothetical protein n=1 Tax=Flavobacterium sp. MMLR14_040 TaxID=3093843 RepID=UPI00298F56FF|nr:hypothetical protein [Flavobacterium sp. MMLR14_040]MDW8850655.1 hypothetical protein [Flavobacterium sp. MMLR14_040]